MSEAPQRFAEGGGEPALKALFAEAQSYTPSSAELASLGAKVTASVGGGVAVGTPAGLAIKAGLSLKLIAALGLIGAGGLYLASSEPSALRGEEAVISEPSAPEPVAAESPAGEVDDEVEARRPTGAVAVPTPTPSKTRPPESRRRRMPNHRAPDVAPSVEPTDVPAVVPSGEADPRVPEARPTESEILQRAQAALRERPLEALGLARTHQEVYPGGVLSQERDLIIIDALERAGRHDRARSRAEGFIARYPNSAHVVRLRQLLSE